MVNEKKIMILIAAEVCCFDWDRYKQLKDCA